MNATELFHQDGRTAGIFFCGECRNVARTEADANQCCAPYKCTVCGTDVDRKTYRTVCPPCGKAKREAAEKARFDAAEKLTEWDGWIMAEGIGYRDGFFQSVDELREYIEGETPDEEEMAKLTEEEKEDIIKMPAYVWTCDPSYFCKLSIEDVTEQLTENCDAYEDFSVDDMSGVEELEKAIDAFNEANAGVVSYQPNMKRALVLSESNERVEATGPRKSQPIETDAR